MEKEIKIQATYIFREKTEISEVPKDFISLKETIKKLYNLTSEQINNCHITYKDKNDKTINIMEEKDFQEAKLISEQIIFSIELQENKPINQRRKNKMENNKIEIIEINEEVGNMNFLHKKKIEVNKLPYIQDEKEIYVNLFEIFINKPLKLYQYPFSITPEIEPGDYKIRPKIFGFCGIGERENRKTIKDFYETCFISGDSLYSIKEINNPITFNCKIFCDGLIEYNITIQLKSNERTINQNDIKKDALTKQFIELLIKDILHSNPNLKFYKGLFVLKNEKKIFEGNFGELNLYQGYITSFVETEGENYLNVNLKNKLILDKSIFEIIEENKNQNKLKDLLIGKRFQTFYSNKNYIIDDILFDRTPKNQIISYDNQSISLENYYKIKYSIKIKNLKQPLLVTRKYKEVKEKKKCLFFIPELCYLSEFNKELYHDKYLMKSLSYYTKLTVNDRIKKTNEFLKLLIDQNKIDKYKLSALEKSKLYGIEVKPINKLHKSYFIKKTIVMDNSKKEINLKDKVFDLVRKRDMTNWLCFYNKSNYNEGDFFL